VRAMIQIYRHSPRLNNDLNRNRIIGDIATHTLRPGC
jgi:hypothetical protein